MYCIEELFGPPPAGAVNVRIADAPVRGEGGTWLPVATEVAPGIFFAGLIRLEPGGSQVNVYQPPWTFAETALGAAIKLAPLAAA